MTTKLIPDQDFSVVSPQSLIANGGFETWNYGTSLAGVTATSVQLPCDQWATYKDGSGSYDFSRESGAGNFDSGTYSLKVNVTSVGSSTWMLLDYRGVSGLLNPVDYRGRTLTLSVRIKTSVANKIRIGIYDGTGAPATTNSNYHTGSGNFETLTATRTIGAAANVIRIWIGMFTGDVSTGIYYVDSAMLVLGTLPVSFIPDLVDIDKVKAGAVSDLQKNSTSNLLVNGGFEQWQRGTSFSTPATASYTADRWKITYSTGGGGPVFTVAQEASIIDNGLSLKLDITTPGTANLCHIAQDVENWAQYIGKTVTLSVRIKTNVANSIRALLFDGTTNTFSGYHTGDNTWQTLTVTAALPGGTNRLLIKIGAILNGDVQTSTTYIDSAMLVVGTSPSPFVPVHPADDLARCQRYYEKNTLDIQMGKPIGRTGGNNYVRHDFTFQVMKGAVPSMTITKLSADVIHLPTTGTGTISEFANWNFSSTAAGTSNFRFLASRTDQTTYPVLEIDFNWTAEVT